MLANKYIFSRSEAASSEFRSFCFLNIIKRCMMTFACQQNIKIWLLLTIDPDLPLLLAEIMSACLKLLWFAYNLWYAIDLRVVRIKFGNLTNCLVMCVIASPNNYHSQHRFLLISIPNYLFHKVWPRSFYHSFRLHLVMSMWFLSSDWNQV